jgi:prepilin-type N-terminal cleavage/methylation domain-containing protein
MRLHRAFTFSELIIVVAALAILAAAAVPRFIAINSDIRTGAVDALAVNVQSSAQLINRIWLSSGQPAMLTVDGQLLELRFGFPTENSISEIVINNGDFVFNDGYFKHRELLSEQGCAVLYIPPSNAESSPVVIPYTDGC